MRSVLVTAIVSAAVLTGCGAPAPSLGPDGGPDGARSAPDLRLDRGPARERGEALTIERVFGSPSLTGPSPRGLRFSPDGARITFQRAREDDRTVLDLWAMDVAGGRTYRLVDARALVPQEGELSEAEIQYRERARISQTGVVAYDWDAEGRAILVPMDGDLFHVDVESGEARRLTETPEFETDARISPDGRHVSFIRDQNLWVHDLETGAARALTEEGEGAVSWGVAEFVAQEEMRRFTGYWWSPDGSRIAAARIDETPVDIVPRFGITAEGVNVADQRYPRAGTPNALIELWVIDVASGNRVQVDLGAQTDIYLARVNWNEAGDRLYVQRQNRGQTQLDVLVADPATGASDLVLREEAETWINLSSDLTPLAGGGFLWTSERTGFRHIYHVDAQGGVRALSQGEWAVDRITGLSGDGATVYFEGWVETPLERHLYAVAFEGGTPVQITRGAGAGVRRWARAGRPISAHIPIPIRRPRPGCIPSTGRASPGSKRMRWMKTTPTTRFWTPMSRRSSAR